MLSRLGGLRARLMGVVGLAALPAIALVLYTVSEQRRVAMADATATALTLAQAIVSDQQQLIGGAHQLLTALAQLPEVRHGERAACDRLAAAMLARFPLYTNLGAARSDSGDIFCTGVPLGGRVNVADRSYAREAIARRAFAVGEYQIGRVTGKATLTFAYPVFDGGGRVHDADVQRVRLTIADTGPGIPAEVRAKIFEPFFTTKPAGEGTGLGLSLCRGIAEEHGGTLGVDSEPGRGAEFVLELPATAPADASASRAEPPARVSPKAILVVDDEPEIAATLAEAFERDGHKVDIAGDGAEGLDRLGAHAYDVIFTDTRMPGLDGVAFYQELARRFPALTQRLIFVTGDLMDRNKREFLEGTGCPVIPKPFDLDEVRRALHRLLTTAS